MKKNILPIIIKNINHIIFHCGNLKRNEPTLLLYDNSTKNLADLFKKVIKKITEKITLIHVGNLKFHGEEVNKKIEIEMCKSKLILCLTKYSLAHSSARIEASKKGARFLSLPNYSLKFIKDNSINVNFKKIGPQTRKISNILSKGKSINITSKRGTNLNLKISKRKANSCPGYVVKNGDLGSPPDIEANISPLEQFSNGIAFIDGSVTHPKIKLLKKPIKLIIKNGKIHEIEVDDKNVKKILNKIFQKKSSKRRVLAECGIGLNPKAKLSGHMLTDEGSKGCIHLGFGANHTVGGKNKINFHIDLVMKNTSLYVDNKLIIDKGKLQI
jgi:2,5-dihydroxypyridine 5,6-dioxygenase